MMDGLYVIAVLFVLYFVIRNAVEDGINRSVLGKDKISDDLDDEIT